MMSFSDCYWLLDALLEYTTHARVPPMFADLKYTSPLNSLDLPERMEGKNNIKIKIGFSNNKINVKVYGFFIMDINCFTFFQAIIFILILRFWRVTLVMLGHAHFLHAHIERGLFHNRSTYQHQGTNKRTNVHIKIEEVILL